MVLKLGPLHAQSALSRGMLSVVEAWLLSTKPVLFSIANRDFNYAPLRSLFVSGVNCDFSYAELRLLFDYAQSAS